MSSFRILITAGIILAVSLSANLTGSLSQAKNTLVNDEYAVLLPTQKDSKISGLVPAVQSAKAQGWKEFSKKHGQWQVSIDKSTGTPRCAFGNPIKIDGYSSITEENVEAAALTFLKENQSLFNIDINNIKISRKDYVDGKWYVSFKQYYKDIEVLLANIELRIFKNGNVMAFDIEYFNNIGISTEPSVSTAAAVDIAGGGMETKSKVSKTLASGKTYILPVKNSGSAAYRLVYKVHVTPENMIAKYVTYVDAHKGDIAWRYNSIQEATNHEVKGGIKKVNPLSDETVMPFSNMYVKVGSDVYTSNANGVISCDVTAKTKVTAGFTGPWVNVQAVKMNLGLFSDSIVPGSAFNVIFDDDNSHSYERNQFYHANYIHDFYKALDPQLTCMDRQMAVVLSYEYDQMMGPYPNAYSNEDTIVFINLQNSIARMPDGPSILFHEYGHSLNTLLYMQKGREDGMENSTLHEALADITSAAILDVSTVGIGVYTKEPQEYIRNLKNDLIYPDSIDGESHHDSQILSGALWDLREKTSIELLRKLHHFTRYSLVDDPNAGVVFYQWLIETLIADDDDGNIVNGTPHYTEIVESFNNHHIGISLFYSLNYSHTPLEETQNTTTPYNVEFSFGDEAPVLGVPDSATVTYQVKQNGITSQSYSIQAVKQANSMSYSVAIPPQNQYSTVSYLINIYLKGMSSPVLFGDKSKDTPYTFLVGYKTAQFDNFETETQWQNGSEEDEASNGIWERGKPFKIDLSMMGFDVIKPDQNHTSNGNYYYSTGLNGIPDEMKNNMNYVLSQLVPDGNTTLNSPVYNFNQLEDIYIKYYIFFRRFTYPGMNIGYDPRLATEVSNDGGQNWVTVSIDSSEGSSEWVKKIIPLQNYIQKSDNCQIRFKYITYYGYPFIFASVSVDDFEVLHAGDGKVSVEDESQSWNNMPVYPNPFISSVNIGYTADISGKSYVTISNLQGEVVFSKEMSSGAGMNSFVWDGKDNSSTTVSPGMYIYKIISGGQVIVGKLIRQQ